MVLPQRLRELAQVRVRYGSQRLYILLRREGWPDNHKRVHRLCCLPPGHTAFRGTVAATCLVLQGGSQITQDP